MENKYWRKEPIKKLNLEQTMYTLVTEESKKYLDYEAVGFMGNSMTYKELFESSEKFANALTAMGIKEGDNVAILTVNMPLVQQCLLAFSKIGATMSWIDLRTKKKDLIKYINSSNCKIAVVFEDILPLIEEISDEINVERIIVCSPKEYLNPVIKTLANIKDKKDGKKIELPSDKRFVTFSDFIKEGKNTKTATANFKKERPSLIVQSSGSTGKSKQIVHTEYNFNVGAQKMAYTDWPLYRGNTMFVSVPPFIIYGLANSVYSCLALTMKAEMMPFVEDDTVYNNLGNFDVSFGVPLHYRYILGQLKQLKKDIQELQQCNDLKSKKILKEKLKELSRVVKGMKKAKIFVSGGDKISAEELIEMQIAFDKPLINGYGNNECLGAAIVSPMYANKPGSIGVPMHGVDIKIINPETGKEVKQGELGELYISSDSLFVNYLNNEEETKKIKEIDGNGKEWVKTGDLCIEDYDGYIFPKGRNRRLIKKNAFKISPATIEDVIMQLPYVKECVVVGVNDEKCLSVPMAFIELDNNISLNDVRSEIINICEDELPDYEIPSYFEQIEKIPYTPNGKQDFRTLEDLGNNIVLESNENNKVYKVIRWKI